MVSLFIEKFSDSGSHASARKGQGWLFKHNPLPTHPVALGRAITRFFADAWMLFPKEEEYMEVRHRV